MNLTSQVSCAYTYIYIYMYRDRYRKITCGIGVNTASGLRKFQGEDNRDAGGEGVGVFKDGDLERDEIKAFIYFQVIIV